MKKDSVWSEQMRPVSWIGLAKTRFVQECKSLMVLFSIMLMSYLVCVRIFLVDLIFCFICLIWPLEEKTEDTRYFWTLEGVKDGHEEKFPFLAAVIQVDFTGLKRDW